MTLGAHKWSTVPDPEDLRAEAIHVWRVQLDVVGSRALEDLLTQDEADRKRRFRFEADRRRFTIARGTLRLVLGHYLDVDPARVRFGSGRCGKPTISIPRSDIRFNVSHAADMALIAVSRRRELGVDIEHLRPVAPDDRTAERFFAPGEVRTLRSLAHDAQAEAFFSCWTRKEAYLKARGVGLSFELDRFEVSLAPRDRAALLRVFDDPEEPARWAMVDLRPAPGYIGALVAERGDWSLSFHEWPN